MAGKRTLPRGSLLIPREFHFVLADGENPRFHLAHLLSLRSCLETQRPESLHLHCAQVPSGRYWREIARAVTVQRDEIWRHADVEEPSGTPWWCLPAWKRTALEKTAERGGVYADLGTLFLQPLPAGLFDPSFVLAAAPETTGAPSAPRLATGFWMTAPRSRFAARWLDAWPAGEDGDPFLPERLERDHPSELRVRPPHPVYPFPPTSGGLAALFETVPTESRELETLHPWPALWWSWRRTDVSLFHAGHVGETWVRRADTEYGRAALPFLPPESASGRILEAGMRRVRRVGRTANRGLAEARAIAHLGLYDLLGDRWTPGGAPGARRAARRRAFLEALRSLELGGGIDEAIVHAVIDADEYGVVPRRFDRDDVIVDVGAHVGTFSHLCHRRGSRRIFAFEPDPVTFRLLERNLGRRAGIRLDRRAVFRNDERDARRLHPSPRSPTNSGAVTVMFGGGSLGIQTQEVWVAGERRAAVETIALDDVLRACGHVRLLKLDCEGSEFPILLTSRELARVDEIVGEYHEMEPRVMASVTEDACVEGFEAYRASALVDALSASGFDVATTAMDRHLGLFHAVRDGKATELGEDLR